MPVEVAAHGDRVAIKRVVDVVGVVSVLQAVQLGSCGLVSLLAGMTSSEAASLRTVDGRTERAMSRCFSMWLRTAMRPPAAEVDRSRPDLAEDCFRSIPIAVSSRTDRQRRPCAVANPVRRYTSDGLPPGTDLFSSARRPSAVSFASPPNDVPHDTA